MKTKICKCCQKEKPVSEFLTSTSTPDGYQSWCRDCINEYSHKKKLYKALGGVKYCRKCHRMLPRTEFNKCTSHKDGLQSYCKDCDREHGRLKNGSTGVYKEEHNSYDLTKFSTGQILSELRNRGYKGEIYKTEKLSI